MTWKAMAEEIFFIIKELHIKCIHIRKYKCISFFSMISTLQLCKLKSYISTKHFK